MSSLKWFRHLALCLVVFCAAAALAQSSPSLSVAPLGTVTVTRGKTALLRFELHVNHGFHVNSHTPGDELLVPTTLHFDMPQGFLITSLRYPAGEQFSLPMLTQKLNVYTGAFVVSGELHAPASASAGLQHVRGEVKYQACDNRQCFPPKSTSFDFNVQVVNPQTHTFTTHIH